VIKLREFCVKYPGAGVVFRIAPTDYIKEENSYGRLKLSPVRAWNFDQEGVNKLIRLKASTILEVYSTNSKSRIH